MGTSKSKSQGSILVHPFVENPSLSNINSNSDTLLDHMRDILQTEHSNFVLKDVQDRARGCMFGAFIGDSMGSRLEQQEIITEDDILDALQMNGGGQFKLIPGQLTDDTELAIAQAFGILGSFSNNINDVANNILKYYFQWIISYPFEFSMAMQSSWNPLLFQDWETLFQNNDIQTIAKQIQDNVKNLSYNSKSNGFLMKQSSLGIFLWKYPQDVIFQFALQDTLLTHCNPFCLDVSRIYLYALSQLIKRGNNDHFIIYCEIKSIIENNSTFKQEIKDVLKSVELLFDGIDDQNYQLKQKPMEYERARKPEPCTTDISLVKWAFIFSMIALLSDKIVVNDFFKFVLSQKGDTDTNLCISGAIVGARFGMSVFDKKIIEKVENCKPETNNEQIRPKIYAPGCYKQLSDLLILKSFERDFLNK